MVSFTTAAIFASLGLMIYLAVPAIVMGMPIHIRQRVGQFYFKLAARSLKQFTLCRRVLSGYDVLPIKVDDEQKLLKAKLSGSTLGGDNHYRFGDPDNRIKRLFNKPVALTFELVPAAIDATLSEWGHWVNEKATEKGFWSSDYLKNPDDVAVDTYVETSDELRLVDPVDAFNIVGNDVDPENIKTTEQLTKKRYEKYRDGLGIKQTARVAIGFALGAGGFVGIQYMNEEVMGNGSGTPSAPIVGNETLVAWVDPAVVMDMAVTVV